MLSNDKDHGISGPSPPQANPISSYTVQSWFLLNNYHQAEAEIQLLEEDLDLRKVRMEGKKKSSMFGYLFFHFIKKKKKKKLDDTLSKK